MALLGLLGIVLALIPGVINSSEQVTVMAPSGGLCVGSIVPILLGLALVILGGRKAAD